MAKLGNARIPLQVDISFGDSVVPREENLTYPTLLDLPAPELKAYRRETVIAEKLEAMVTLGAANSRMKDFYDLWMLARRFDFDGDVVRRAIVATFQARGKKLPEGLPYAMTEEFVNDPTKQTQWRAFLNRGRLVETPPPFGEVVASIRAFVMSPLSSAAAVQPFNERWQAGGPWRPAPEGDSA